MIGSVKTELNFDGLREQHRLAHRGYDRVKQRWSSCGRSASSIQSTTKRVSSTMSGSWCSKRPISSPQTLQLFLSACAQSSRGAMKRASTRSAGTWKRTYRPHVMRRPHEDGRPRSRRQWEGMARRAVDVATDPHRRHHALAIWWHQAPKRGARHQNHRTHRTRAGGCSSRRGAGRGSSSVPQIHCTKGIQVVLVGRQRQCLPGAC